MHDAHNDYPIATERLEVRKAWMLGYQKNVLKMIYGGSSNELEKLVPNLHDKTRYVLHYCNLQLYLQLRMRLKKIHQPVHFDQSPWIAPYIRMNTDLCKQAKNTFEQDLYKLMNNSVFGKTMDNIRQRIDVKLVRSTEEEKLRKLITNPLLTAV